MQIVSNPGSNKKHITNLLCVEFVCWKFDWGTFQENVFLVHQIYWEWYSLRECWCDLAKFGVSIIGWSFVQVVLCDCCHYNTKTYLYNFDPFKPHFYIVKLGFTGVYIIFLISAQNIDCGYSLERVPTIYVFEQKYDKYQNFLSENFSFFDDKIFSIFE